MSKAKLSERCDAFARGEWLSLVEASRVDAQSCSTATSRRRRRGSSGDMMGRRAKRALQLTQWGELSSARHALEGALVAPGNERTRTMLSDPSPPRAQSPRCTRAHRTQSRRPSGFGRRIVVTEPPQVTPRGRSRTVWFDWSGFRGRQCGVLRVRSCPRHWRSPTRSHEGHPFGSHDRAQQA